MRSMKQILTEWRRLTEVATTQFPGPAADFKQIVDWFSSLSGSRMMFYDIETIGTTYSTICFLKFETSFGP